MDTYPLHCSTVVLIVVSDPIYPCLEGNQCKMFIDEKNIEVLQTILNDNEYPVDVVDMFCNALSSIRDVYTSCGGKTLKTNWRDCTRNFV